MPSQSSSPSPEKGVALTKPKPNTLKWLKDRGGDGIFDKNGVLLAGGEKGGFMRSTWNVLRDAGLIEFYRPNVRGASRCRIIDRARATEGV